jgi:hypothetical protein
MAVPVSYYVSLNKQLCQTMSKAFLASIKAIYKGVLQGRIQDYKLGGGAHLKKLRRAEGGAKSFGVFHVKNHHFTPKKIIFLPGASPPLP